MEDLAPGDFVGVECAACRHVKLIPAVGLTQGLRLPPHTFVLSLESRFGCRECDQRGRVALSIRWAEVLARSVRGLPKQKANASGTSMYRAKRLSSRTKATMTE
jgi:hypothetical protein